MVSSVQIKNHPNKNDKLTQKFKNRIKIDIFLDVFGSHFIQVVAIYIIYFIT